MHRRTVQKQWDQAQAQAGAERIKAELLIEPVGSDDDRASLNEEEIAAEEDALVAAVSEATRGSEHAAPELFHKEQQLLDKMTELAESSRFLPDARVNQLISWIRTNMCPNLGTAGAKWNNTRVIVFTEYEDTRRYLQQQLGGAIASSDQAEARIAVYHGPTPANEREEIKTAFNTEPEKNPVRILIATDAAREGLNLQAHCWNLFHFDVPWNPSRMEQRNGRIDRKLQPSKIVRCHYFFYVQRPEDRVIAALVKKTKTIREELGSLSQVIDRRLDALLKTGIRRKEIDNLTRSIETLELEKESKQVVEDELEAARERQLDLRNQIERLSTMLSRSQQEIAFSKDHFRSAVSCSLEILGAEKLKCSGNGEMRCQFPPLDQREGADPSWAETMDSLRAPRKKDQKFWDWRHESPIRPVVFEDPGVVTEEVVQLHLEQRVVQRLLARFTAQGFVYHDLSRACLAQTSDAIARVILLGRLSLYGPNAARLHEQLIPVTARWIDPAVRKGHLSPYAREAESRTLALLDSALLEKHSRQVPEEVMRQLRAAAANDVRELLPHLQTRAKEYAEDAVAKLKHRADDESKKMREILEAQKKHLEETVTRYKRDDQLKLQFNEEEKRQLEANQRYWDKRLISLESELKTEPDRIRAQYDVRAQRVEPIGLVYLWPISR